MTKNFALTTVSFFFLGFYSCQVLSQDSDNYRFYSPHFGVVAISELGSGKGVKYARIVEHTDPLNSHLKVLKKLRFRSDVPREIISGCLAAFMDQLRHDAEYVSRFGQIALETISPAPGVLLQAMATGVRFEVLEDSVRAFARSEVEAAAKFLENKFEGFTASRYLENYRFVKASGRIAAVFDILTDSKPQPYLEWHQATKATENIAASQDWQPHIIQKLGSGYNGSSAVIDNAPENARGLNKVKVFRDGSVDKAQRFVQELRNLRHELGGIIPLVMSAEEAGIGKRPLVFIDYNPGFILYENLSSDSKLRADANVEALKAKVSSLGLKGLDINKTTNMVFSPDGEIGLFFDPIIHL